MEFPVREGETGVRAGTGETDDVLGTDVTGEETAADGEPADVTAAEEEVGGGVLASGRPDRHAGDDREVADDHGPVEPVEGHGGRFRRACDGLGDLGGGGFQGGVHRVGDFSLRQKNPVEGANHCFWSFRWFYVGR